MVFLRKTLLYLAVFAFAIPAFAGQNNCVLKSITYLLSHERIEAETGAWRQALIKTYLEGEKRGIQSQQKAGILESFKNRIFTSVLERRLKRLLRTAGGQGDVDTILRTILAEAEKLRNSPYRTLFDGRVFSEITTLGARKDEFMKAVKALTGEVQTYIGDYENDVKILKRKYGADLFSDSTMSRSAMNIFLLRKLAVLSGTTASDRSAMTAAALLHPLVDDLMDGGFLAKEFLGKLAKVIDGEHIPAVNRYERLVFDLVHDIQLQYPIHDHPRLHDIIRQLFNVQLESMAQRASMAQADLLALTIDKGGLSTAMYGYIASGRLKPGEFEFYYKGGGVYQLTDDLADISEDLADKIDTVWTRALREKQSIDGPLAGMLAAKAQVSTEIPRMLATYPNPREVTNFVNLSFYAQNSSTALKFAGGSTVDSIGTIARMSGLGLSEKQLSKGVSQFLSIKADPKFRRQFPYLGYFEQFLFGSPGTVQKSIISTTRSAPSAVQELAEKNRNLLNRLYQEELR